MDWATGNGPVILLWAFGSAMVLAEALIWWFRSLFTQAVTESW